MDAAINNKEWVKGFSVPLKAKLALFLLGFFAILGFGLTGYKMENWVMIAICMALCTLIFGGTFYTTEILVDTTKKNIYVRKRFIISWTDSYSYEGKKLLRDSRGEIYDGHRAGGINGSTEIYLSSSPDKTEDLIFSSSVYDDFDRVMDYLSQYVERW